MPAPQPDDVAPRPADTAPEAGARAPVEPPARRAAPGVDFLMAGSTSGQLAHLNHWKALLLGDLLLAIAVIGAGVTLAIVWIWWAGALIALAGLAYLWVVRARYHHWRELRREDGLPT